MVLMALDHTRDFWGLTPFEPTDLAETSVGLFLTRWVTHFCAPVFVLLTGTSAFLHETNAGAPKRTMSKYLLFRGLWLVLLEITVVNLSWRFALGGFVFLAVLWVIGCSMILLAGLVWLPRWAVMAFAAAVICGHNLFDHVSPDDVAMFSWLWKLLHVPGFIPLTESFGFGIGYPLIPWCGVMALGYSLGPWILRNENGRLLAAGGLSLVLFAVLRGWNIYGDPSPWDVQGRGPGFTLLSFLNVSKYPPSLLYLLVTLGPSLLLLSVLESWKGVVANIVLIFGRVPLFFYLLHIPMIRFTATCKNLFLGQQIDPFGVTVWPQGYKVNLAAVYLVWGILLVVLFPACRRFGKLKRSYPRSLFRFF